MVTEDDWRSSPQGPLVQAPTARCCAGEPASPASTLPPLVAAATPGKTCLRRKENRPDTSQNYNFHLRKSQVWGQASHLVPSTSVIFPSLAVESASRCNAVFVGVLWQVRRQSPEGRAARQHTKVGPLLLHTRLARCCCCCCQGCAHQLETSLLVSGATAAPLSRLRERAPCTA